MSRKLQRFPKVIAGVTLTALVMTSTAVSNSQMPKVSVEMAGTKTLVKKQRKKAVSQTLQIERAIRRKFGPTHDDTAVCLAVSESVGPINGRSWRPGMKATFNPNATSHSGDHGLFQANYAAHHWPGETVAQFHARMAKVWYAIKWAYKLSQGGKNFNPWTGTYGRGMCHNLS